MRLTIPEFADKKALFAYLTANKAMLIEQKKSELKKADAFSITGTGSDIIPIVKAASGSTDTAEKITRTIIANTYLWMDSHDDVHIPGVFAKAIQSKTPFHLHDHLFQVDAEVGKPKSVTEKYIDWTALGIQKAGQTQALFIDSEIFKDMNPKIFGKYQAGHIQQHSVGMIYVRLNLVMNDPEAKESKAMWDLYYPQLGNPDKADAKGYFWAVHEAKLPEFSCVLEGSNILTPTLATTNEDKANTSTESAPSEDTRTKPRKSIFSSIGSQIKN